MLQAKPFNQKVPLWTAALSMGEKRFATAHSNYIKDIELKRKLPQIPSSL